MAPNPGSEPARENDPNAAGEAIATLRRLIVADTQDVDEQELMRLADVAVGGFTEAKDRKEIADMLIGALTVLRFAAVFGNDAGAARARISAILDAIVKATIAPRPPNP